MSSRICTCVTFSHFHHFVTFSLDHFVTFSLDRLLLPIDMTEFTPLQLLYAQLALHAQLYADSSTVRSIAVIARSVAATDRPHLVVYDRSDYLHCMIAPLPPLINPSIATMVRMSSLLCYHHGSVSYRHFNL